MCTEMSAWWWLLVTETCSKLYIVEYSVVFWLNDILVSTKTQPDGSYQIVSAHAHTQTHTHTHIAVCEPKIHLQLCSIIIRYFSTPLSLEFQIYSSNVTMFRSVSLRFQQNTNVG
jgi:hypothetical protein